MHVFLKDELVDDLMFLDSHESTHAFRVLRLVADDLVVVFDGLGSIYRCKVVEPNPKKGVLKVLSVEAATMKPHPVSIAVAPTKSADRFEWFVEKACELGVDQIIPVISDRSERRKLNLERTRKLILSACKQSMNPWFPILHDPIPFSTYIKESKPGLIAHCLDSSKTPISLIEISKHDKWTVLIGPEGDFTSLEIELAVSLGWEAISLGSNRLRTETAAMYALTALVLKSTSDNMD